MEDGKILRRSVNHARRAYVDFVFGLDYLSINSRLLTLIHQAMAARGLSCLLVNKTSVEQILDATRRGRIAPLVYLDLCARPGGPFAALLQAMHAAGAYTLCQPQQIPWTEKSFSHPRLAAAGLPVPPTILIRKDEPDRDLTATERALAGDRCVIKPNYGVAGLGVVAGVEPTPANIRAAREFNRNDDWLIQRMISWKSYDGRPAYLRGYNVLGHRTLMWWSPEKGYARLTWNDFRKYDLLGAVELMHEMTALTGLDFFSTEIAITQDTGPDRFVMIDYVNDQCDIDPSAQPQRSPPESWVAWICGRLAEFTFSRKHNLSPTGAGTLYLA